MPDLDRVERQLPEVWPATYELISVPDQGSDWRFRHAC